MPSPASLYFLHIPKTAGTSLGSLLHRYGQPDQWLPVYVLPDLLALDRQTITSYRYFRGHFGAGLFGLIDRQPSSITMLRDPFEHLVSLIQHARRGLKEWDIANLPPDLARIFKVLSGNDYLMETALDPVASPLFTNVQSRYLGCELDLKPLLGHASPLLTVETLTRHETDLNAMVKKAKQRLDKMDVVGIVERFDDSCHLICDFLGIHFQESYPQLNVAPDRQARGPFSYRQSGMMSAELVSRISDLLRYDYEVYEYGKVLFQRQHDAANRKGARRPGWMNKFFSKLRALLRNSGSRV